MRHEHEWQLQKTFTQTGGIRPQTTEFWGCKHCGTVTHKMYVTDYTDPQNPLRREIEAI